MSNGFDFFDRQTQDDSSPQIRLRKSGQLVLTPGAVELLGKDADQVQVGFNASTRAVGIRKAASGSSGKYQLRPQKGSTKRLLDCRRFFAHHGLGVEQAQSFEVESFGGGIVGFRFPKAEAASTAAAEAEPRKAAGRKARVSR